MSSTPNDANGTSSHRAPPIVALIHSPAYRAVLARCSPAVLLNRYALLDYLLHAFCAAESAPLWPQLRLVAPQPASRAQLEDFHASEYVDALEAADALIDGNGNGSSATVCAVQRPARRTVLLPSLLGDSADECTDHGSTNESDAAPCGLCDDCEPFPGVFKYARWVAGASLCAAQVLTSGRTDIAVNFGGGWHHARPARSAGFCFVNDCVLAILALQEGGLSRVLYVDIDAHHGDGVQDAFYAAEEVFTLSFHHRTPGFFPGTGHADERGAGRGRFRSLNIPLRAGCSDTTFLSLFDRFLPPVLALHRPHAIVLQCGADALGGDPLGSLNLSSRAYAAAARALVRLRLPLLILGGGGYHAADTARCWAHVLATACGAELPPVVPDVDEVGSGAAADSVGVHDGAANERSRPFAPLPLPRESGSDAWSAVGAECASPASSSSCSSASYLCFGPTFDSHAIARPWMRDQNSRAHLLDVLAGVQRFFNDATAHQSRAIRSIRPKARVNAAVPDEISAESGEALATSSSTSPIAAASDQAAVESDQNLFIIDAETLVSANLPVSQDTPPPVTDSKSIDIAQDLAGDDRRGTEKRARISC